MCARGLLLCLRPWHRVQGSAWECWYRVLGGQGIRLPPLLKGAARAAASRADGRLMFQVGQRKILEEALETLREMASDLPSPAPPDLAGGLLSDGTSDEEGGGDDDNDEDEDDDDDDDEGGGEELDEEAIGKMAASVGAGEAGRYTILMVEDLVVEIKAGE